VDIRSLGYRTDIRLRVLEGSERIDHGDHLVVRSPENPQYYWGNFLLLASPPAPGSAGTWLSRFAAEFPAARHLALGIDVTDRRAVDPAEFEAAGLKFGHEVVLTAAAAHQPPRPNSAAQYRPLAGHGDWRQAAELRAACYADEDPGADSGGFLERRIAAERRLAEDGHGSWFGAFTGGRLAARVGIFSAGRGIARHQSVETHPAARGQGLAGTLVYQAGRYAVAELAARTLVIVAESGHQAERVYRLVGFEASEDSVSFERPPS
jgi:ribosomal protein S18 acetylase RimI-like enzyme